jgi:hypothetical protein
MQHPPPQQFSMSLVPPSPIILLASSAFCEIKTVDALRGRGSLGISSSSAEELEVSDGTEDRGEALSTGGSSGIQCEVVFVRIAIGRSMAVVKDEGAE